MPLTERFSELTRQHRARMISREAAHVLGEAGCFKLRVDDVAQRAGVAKGTVYLDFGSKASLLSGSLASACEQLMDAIEARISEKPTAGEQLHEALIAVAASAVGPAELRLLIEGRLPCTVRWAGGDSSPYEQIERRLAGLVSAWAPGSGAEPLAVAQGVLAVASTPASRRLAAERGPAVLASSLVRVAQALTVTEPPEHP